MSILELFLFPFFVCFFLCVLGFFLHSPFFIVLIYTLKKVEKEKTPPTLDVSDTTLPFQIVQLPVFNEDITMVKNLIDSACSLYYPKEKLIIQLLDDSDKEEISTSLYEYIQLMNQTHSDIQLHYYHRSERSDYKAGNLNYGLAQARQMLPLDKNSDKNTTFISIFDADFQIPEDYFAKTLHLFQDTKVCAIQANMHFLNKQNSILTRAASIFQENLHRVDFMGRSKTNHLTTFKGSAGSWRYSALEECGFWKGDTQIEDVDLSFDAQARGWKILYTDSISCPSLLPASYNAFKLQQRSWMKGIMEVMRKQLGSVLFSPKLTFGQKIMALDFFLIFSLQSLFMVVSHLTLIPTYYFWASFANPSLFHTFVLLLPLLLAMTHIPFLAIEIGDRNGEKKAPITTLFAFGLMTALFPTLTYGLTEGLFGVQVHRDRTGKKSGNSKGKTTLPTSSLEKLKRINIFEWIMAIYAILVVCWALGNGFYKIALVYSTLATIYPVNAAISSYLLKKN